MSLRFLRDFGARRLAQYDPQPTLLNAPSELTQDEPEDVELGYETDPESWTARTIEVPLGWRGRTWDERPTRFVDGKDVGQTIAWLEAPGGYPIPVRLSQIGGVAVKVVDGVCSRETVGVERVVSMVAAAFPWDEVEGFASALQEHGFRLLPAQPPEKRLSYDFEQMRRVAQFRSNNEMGVLEESVLAQASETPTIVDGRLEPRAGGFDSSTCPVAGVIKTHAWNYLHPRGLQLVYQLAPGQRTPLFALPNAKLPVVSWYLRLAGENGSQPSWGVVRVELPLRWYEKRNDGLGYVARLSRLLCEYRCRDSSYGRAHVSLHPIVRAEQLLGSLFVPTNLLGQRFCRLTGL